MPHEISFQLKIVLNPTLAFGGCIDDNACLPKKVCKFESFFIFIMYIQCINYVYAQTIRDDSLSDSKTKCFYKNLSPTANLSS